MHRSTIDLFKNATHVETFPAGAVILSEGTPGHTMYVIQAGTVELSCRGKRIDTIGEGQILGEMALVGADEERSATAKAITECRLVPIDLKRFEFLVQQTPYFAVEVIRIMANRLRHMNKILTEA